MQIVHSIQLPDPATVTWWLMDKCCSKGFYCSVQDKAIIFFFQMYFPFIVSECNTYCASEFWVLLLFIYWHCCAAYKDTS